MFVLNKRNTSLVSLVILVFISIILLFVSTNKNKLQVSPKKSNNIAGPIVIKNNEPLKQGSGVYEITPAAAGNLQIIDNYIVFWPDHDNSFGFDTSYKAVFKDFKTNSDKVLKNISLDFKISKNSNYDKLQKEVLTKYGRLENTGNPLLKLLPYQKDFSYRISYTLNKQPEPKYNQTESGIIALLGTTNDWREKKENYTIHIETLVTQTRNQEYQAFLQDIKQARQDALKWISEQGIDTTKDIIYDFTPSDKELANTSIAPEAVNHFDEDF